MKLILLFSIILIQSYFICQYKNENVYLQELNQEYKKQNIHLMQLAKHLALLSNNNPNLSEKEKQTKSNIIRYMNNIIDDHHNRQ